jgi:Tfp pilus assembly protein PilF
MSEPAVRITAEQVHAAIERRDMDAAIRLAHEANRQGLEHPLVLNLMAYDLELQDRLDEALAVLRRARQLSPGDAFVLNSIGVCHSKADRPHDALAAFDAALALDPNLAHAHNGRGLALAALGDLEGARAAQLRAAQLNPEFPEPLGALASLAAEAKDWQAARDYATRALALEADQPAASLAMAAVEIEERDFAAAEARMSRLIAAGRLTKLHLAGAETFLADALDGLGRPKEAMAAYIAANRELRSVQVRALEGVELGLATCRRITPYFEAARPADWQGAPETGHPGGEIGHVFLVGFPRSGTTLLEQVLASHSDFVALEEKPTADEAVVEFFLDGDPGALDRLSGLDAAAAQPWRELYWKRVRDFGVDPTGKVFVDKLPIYTIYLPLVAKLFPRAKVLLARRDPRDVVVSCFRHRFRPNRIVAEFTDLERTAELYAATMNLSEIYRELLPTPIHVHRHEDLVADFDASTQAICDFLGVAWDPKMRDFVETANRRNIQTPSASQVRRGLNASGLGQWRKYGEAIDVIQPILAPWVERFGYEPT